MLRRAGIFFSVWVRRPFSTKRVRGCKRSLKGAATDSGKWCESVILGQGAFGKAWSIMVLDPIRSSSASFVQGKKKLWNFRRSLNRKTAWGLCRRWPTRWRTRLRFEKCRRMFGRSPPLPQSTPVEGKGSFFSELFHDVSPGPKRLFVLCGRQRYRRN